MSFTLFRYFSKNFFVWFAVFMFGLLAIALLFDFSELIRRAADKPNITMWIITKLVLLQLPFLGQQLLPFTILFTAMFVLYQYNRSNEIVAVRAAGISVWKMLAPIGVCALAIGLFDLSVMNPVSSTMLARHKILTAHHFYGERNKSAVSETGIWLGSSDASGTSIMRVERVNTHQNKLFDITILKFNQANKLVQRTDAARGTFNQSGLLLEKVWVFPVHKTPQHFDQLMHSTDMTLSKIQEGNLSPELISFWKLPKFTTLIEKSGLSGLKYRLQWHSLIARAFWLLAMVILAATCTLRPLRQGRGAFLIVVGLSMGFILYFLKDITYAMGLAATLPIILSAWTPVGISAMLGVAFLLHSEDG